jgi:predicted ATP-dependent serine protease
MPGEGKSTFAIQFAKYLAENIGRVVYISGEEGFTKTLRDKFMNNDGVSKYLDIADLRTFDDVIKNIPAEVYNFIFIDSLDNMRIDAEKMKKIRERYKNSSLITISQSTKDGKIRGSNELVHDSDIAVKVENGIALTIKNRFKAKGMQLEVFS